MPTTTPPTQSTKWKTPIRFGRFGMAENPLGRDVVFVTDGRERIARVAGVYRREGYNAATMLHLKYFCGDDAPDVHVGAVWILRYPGEEPNL